MQFLKDAGGIPAHGNHDRAGPPGVALTFLTRSIASPPAHSIQILPSALGDLGAIALELLNAL
jgi:hypothetical protein